MQLRLEAKPPIWKRPGFDSNRFSERDQNHADEVRRCSQGHCASFGGQPHSEGRSALGAAVGSGEKLSLALSTLND